MSNVLFFNIAVNQQETIFGSSETTCDITFCFNDFIKEKPEHKKINKKFLQWLIGFVEGDGSFIVSKNKVYFDITQSINDVQILYYIKKNLGFGKVILRPEKKIAFFYVTSKENFLKLILLFNGNLCTEYKLNQFNKWLICFNKQYNQNILLKKKKILPSFSNGWLSGFIDAEGCFTGQIKDCSTCRLKKTVLLSFEIAQKDNEILCKIKNLFNFKKTSKILQNIIFDISWNGWRFYSSSFKQHKKVAIYLKLFPLKTKKSLALKKWIEILNLVLKKNI